MQNKLMKAFLVATALAGANPALYASAGTPLELLQQRDDSVRPLNSAYVPFLQAAYGLGGDRITLDADGKLVAKVNTKKTPLISAYVEEAKIGGNDITKQHNDGVLAVFQSHAALTKAVSDLTLERDARPNMTIADHGQLVQDLADRTLERDARPDVTVADYGQLVQNLADRTLERDARPAITVADHAQLVQDLADRTLERDARPNVTVADHGQLVQDLADRTLERDARPAVTLAQYAQQQAEKLLLEQTIAALIGAVPGGHADAAAAIAHLQTLNSGASSSVPSAQPVSEHDMLQATLKHLFEAYGRNTDYSVLVALNAEIVAVQQKLNALYK